MMAAEESVLVGKGVKSVRNFLEKFNNVGVTHSTITHLKVSFLL
jgi:hypothetical protein